ncbi:phosphate starvation-inducible protein PhoH [bacterium TMED277]|nr:MAG: phosphate starvation-inducible protein PhoH [bacterium TMED277]
MGFIESSRAIKFGSNKYLLELCGELDANLLKVEKKNNVQIIRRGNSLTIFGNLKDCDTTADILMEAYSKLEKGKGIAENDIDIALNIIHNKWEKGVYEEENSNFKLEKTLEYLEINTQNKLVSGKSKSQNKFIKSMLDYELVFGIGPAGTGKTYLAIAMGVKLFSEGMVDKIVLTRPAVEAGERLGFLPGDMKEKVDPYMQPLYDALNEFLPHKILSKMHERNSIEIAPLAFMRGRTLKNAFVVMDEAQNASTSQMKMFLTRLGMGSRMVITGDITQIDLPKGLKSGLVEAVEILAGIKEIDFIRFTDSDIVRHSLVRKIAKAYEAQPTKKSIE